jgi:hypothetical protein
MQGQQQQQQQPSKQPQPMQQASEMMDDGFVVEEEGEGLDYFGEMPALELEDSQELKRRIFPAEIVKVCMWVWLSVRVCVGV